MKMKNILCGIFVLTIALFTVNANALTNYKTSDWQTKMPEDTTTESKDSLSGKTVGSRTADSTNKNITIIKGNTDEEGGMKYGPFVEGKGTTVGQGIEEELYIALGKDELPYGELFEISLSLKDPAQTAHYGYANEVNVQTQNVDGDNIKISLTNGTEVATISKSGIYRYYWSIKRSGDKTHLLFKVEDASGNLVGNEAKLDFETAYPVGGDKKNITDNTSMRWLWFCNVKADHVKVYTKQDVAVKNSNISGNQNLAQVLKESLKNSSLADLLQFEDVTISVDVTQTTSEDKKIKSVVEQKLPKAVIAKYLDISVDVKKSNGELAGKLTELVTPIQLSVAIPSDLPALASGYSRKYYVVRNHDDGEIEILDATVSEDGKNILFESQLFSSYALVYADSKEEKVENPDTSDNALSFICIALISATGLGYTVKKRLFN